jgi:branched-subunit amino acid transport protein AzlD
MAKETKKNYFVTLLWASLFVFILGQNYSGFMLIFVIIALLIWVPYSAYVVVRNPDGRRFYFIRLSIWIFAILLVAGIHYIRHINTRHNADEIVTAIISFSTTHGHCPKSLDEIGINRARLKDKLGMSSYICADEKPHLSYGATYVPFNMYSYDFESKDWKNHAD